MAVVVKYIVVRNGVEKMTFATKKEADAHDKMLDIADNLTAFLKARNVSLNEQDMEDVSLLLAENRDHVMGLLRGASPQPAGKAKPAAEAAPSAGEPRAAAAPRVKSPKAGKNAA
jgi:dsDNA-binding SOS-regulon protein